MLRRLSIPNTARFYLSSLSFLSPALCEPLSSRCWCFRWCFPNTSCRAEPFVGGFEPRSLWQNASHDFLENKWIEDCATFLTCNIPHHNIDHLRHDLWCKIQRSSWQFRGCWMQYGENPINCSLWVRWGCLGIAAFGLLGANEFQLHLVSITPPVRLTSSQPNVAMLQWTNLG